jgi:hypothetical protein
MYCSHCGSSIADNVSFCKNCGFRQESLRNEDASRIKRLALTAGAGIGTIGLICFFTILRELLRSGLAPDAMITLLVAYLVALLIMFTVLVRHAFKTSDERTMRPMERAPEQPAYFRAVNTAQLPDMPASVTEHTTRTLDEVRFKDH